MVGGDLTRRPGDCAYRRGRSPFIEPAPPLLSRVALLVGISRRRIFRPRFPNAVRAGQNINNETGVRQAAPRVRRVRWYSFFFCWAALVSLRGSLVGYETFFRMRPNIEGA